MPVAKLGRHFAAFMNKSTRRHFGYLFVGGLFGLVPGMAAIAQFHRLQIFDKGSLAIKTKTGRHEFLIEIAKHPKQQAQGLMYRRRLESNAGMLFLYSRLEHANMWMKNTNIPLDLLFINKAGRIVGINQRTVPHSLEVISSDVPIKAVLEVNAVTVARLLIHIGDQVIHGAFGEKF